MTKLYGIDQPIRFAGRETTIRAELLGQHGSQFRVRSHSLGGSDQEECFAELWGEPIGGSTTFRISSGDYADLVGLGAQLD